MKILYGTTISLECSAKKCDNLLVKTDIFCHFKGPVLCNAKCLQCHLLKNKNIGAQFRKSYILLCSPFFKFTELLLPFVLHKKIFILMAPFSFLIVAGQNLFFTQIRSCIIVTNFKKIWRAHY